MKYKNAKALLSVLLCADLLAGCSVPVVPESSSAPSEASQNSAESAFATPAPAEEPAVSGSGPDSAEAGNTIRKDDLAAYTRTLSRFFHAPVQSTAELPRDYSLAFFLLYQTFESNGEGSAYTQNENFFWEIPESDLLQTAGTCLGLTGLSLSDITEWPFGAPQDGVCFYSLESSLPYGEASVTAEVNDSQYEDASGGKTTLVYHFTCGQRADGTAVYRLESITAP